MKIALTGATGFVGAETLLRAGHARHEVAALTRRNQHPREGVHWVEGTLDDEAAIDALVRGADAVLHIAGVVNAPNRAAFQAGNGRGTANVIASMRRQGVNRLIHVSSLSAREPELSDYGWSKALAEEHVQSSGLNWTIVRPPAIYGGNDKQMLELFQMAQKGFMLLPPGGRLSVIEVGDLARLLLALAADAEHSLHQVHEVDDGTPGGLTHSEFAQAIGRAVGRKRIIPISTPKALLNVGASLDRMVRGKDAKLTPDRVSYFCHPDWVSQAEMAPPSTLWTPQVDTAKGLTATVEAYRKQGWL